MADELKKVLEEALALPEEDRTALIAALTDSLAPEGVQLSPEWTSEVRRRIEEIERGEVELVPGEQVEAELREILARFR